MLLSAATTAAAGMLVSIRGAMAANGADTWVGNTSSSSWSASNWSGTNNPPISGDSLVFGAAGSSGTSLIDNLMTPGTFNIAGITFNLGASAFAINPATAGTNGFTLTGNFTNSSTSLQAINDAVTTTAVRTVTMTSGGGNVTLGGNISGAAGGITTAGAGTLTLSGMDTYTGNTTVANETTLTFGTSGVLGSNSADLTNVSLPLPC